MCEKCIKNWGICEIPSIVSPTIALLNSVAAHYHSKYDIDIEVCKISDLPITLTRLQEGSKQTGILVTSDSGYGHIVPLLVNFKDGNRQVFKLDVLDNSCAASHPITADIYQTAQNLNCEIFVSKNARQADAYSCRTEGLTLLRNALLHLKDNAFINFRAFLTPDQIEETKERTTQFDPCYKVTKTNIILVSDIPLEWDYLDQIPHKNADLNAPVVLRHRYSKKLEKRSFVESAQSFRDRYSREVVFVTKYFISRNLDLSGIPDGELERHFIGDQEIIISKSESSISLEVRRKKTICVYQQTKGYSNALKFGGESFPGNPMASKTG